MPAHRPDIEPLLHPLGSVTLHLPYDVADYVDFYASEHHATNVGKIFRPDGDALTPNWKHLPIGYHGRSGTVVVSGTDVIRPCGQRKTPADAAPLFGPSVKLDIEAEVGFLVGTPPRRAGRSHSATSATMSSGSRSSTTGRRATSRPGSTSRSARSSESPSPRPYPPG